MYYDNKQGKEIKYNTNPRFIVYVQTLYLNQPVSQNNIILRLLLQSYRPAVIKQWTSYWYWKRRVASSCSKNI